MTAYQTYQAKLTEMIAESLCEAARLANNDCFLLADNKLKWANTLLDAAQQRRTVEHVDTDPTDVDAWGEPANFCSDSELATIASEYEAAR
jgi:hypothetical protein